MQKGRWKNKPPGKTGMDSAVHTQATISMHPGLTSVSTTDSLPEGSLTARWAWNFRGIISLNQSLITVGGKMSSSLGGYLWGKCPTLICPQGISSSCLQWWLAWLCPLHCPPSLPVSSLYNLPGFPVSSPNCTIYTRFLSQYGLQQELKLR